MTIQDTIFFEKLFGGDLSNGGFGKEYNIFCCEQGILIATKLETKDAIIKYHKSDSSEQNKLVPELSNEHSGNTFDMACRLAISYLPQLLVEKRDKKIDDILEK